MKTKLEETIQLPTPEIPTHSTCYHIGCKVKNNKSLDSMGLASQMWFCNEHQQQTEQKKW